jgi:hypothetical protein
MLTRPTDGSPAADFIVTYHGTVATLDVLNDSCLNWIEENVEIEPWQRLGDRRIGIDPTVAETLREALAEAGFAERKGARSKHRQAHGG